MKREEALLDEPLVDAKAAVEPSGAVVGEDGDDRLVVDQFEDPADLVVELEVMIADRDLNGRLGGRAGRASGSWWLQKPCWSRSRPMLTKWA